MTVISGSTVRLEVGIYTKNTPSAYIVWRTGLPQLDPDVDFGSREIYINETILKAASEGQVRLHSQGNVWSLQTWP